MALLTDKGRQLEIVKWWKKMPQKLHPLQSVHSYFKYVLCDFSSNSDLSTDFLSRLLLGIKFVGQILS